MDYDMDIHYNPDAQAWAKLFIETTKDMDREVFRDEGYMIAWFANAMMAMHDYLHKTEIERLEKEDKKYFDAELAKVKWVQFWCFMVAAWIAYYIVWGVKK